MNVQDKIQKQIEKKASEIADLESRLSEARGVLAGLQGALSLFPKTPDKSSFEADVESIRKGTDVEKSYKAIRDKGEAMRIEEILIAIGKENIKGAKQALSGQLSYNFRNGRVFTRPAPNTFGLIKWPGSAQPESEDELDDIEGIPDDFGID